MGTKQTPKKGVTPPKGRPTRSRDDHVGGRKVFGATAQWIAVVALIVVLFVILLIVTDGPFGGSDPTGAGYLPISSAISIGATSQPM